jgi:hypothetical protein
VAAKLKKPTLLALDGVPSLSRYVVSLIAMEIDDARVVESLQIELSLST